MRLPALLLALLLAGCASAPLTLPSGPGDVIVATDASGLTFNDQGHDLWVSEGVPASWFVPTPLGWHMTSLLYHQGNAIRVRRLNPALPVTASGTTAKK